MNKFSKRIAHSECLNVVITHLWECAVIGWFCKNYWIFTHKLENACIFTIFSVCACFLSLFYVTFRVSCALCCNFFFKSYIFRARENLDLECLSALFTKVFCTKGFSTSFGCIPLLPYNFCTTCTKFALLHVALQCSVQRAKWREKREDCRVESAVKSEEWRGKSK